MKYLIMLCIVLFTGIAPGLLEEKNFNALEERKVSEVLKQFGVDPHNLPLLDKNKVSVEIGEEIVKYGETLSGRKIKKQSKHFTCVACHNLVKEDPILSSPNPEERLAYAVENDLPFLQATTLYGVVNRTHYYNDDYVKKYGDLVDDARNDLRAAIQLCATECAQGRKLKSWEMESVVAYLNTIDLKMKDLDLSTQEIQNVDNAFDSKSMHDKKGAAILIQSKYSIASPATFVDPPENRSLALSGNAFRGELIYDHSCLHCHENGKFSFLQLDDSNLSLNYLKKNFPKYNRRSVYQVARYGTQPLYGKRSYMPHYTVDRMSERQLEDLRAYIYTEGK